MNLRNRVIAGLGATALLASTVLGAAAELTDGEVVSVEVTGIEGSTVSVLIEETRTFSGVEYSLTEVKTADGELTVTAFDNRGTAKGWKVQLKATDFIKDDQSVGGNILIGNLSLDAGVPQRTSAVGATPLNATDIGSMSNSAQQFWVAALDEGDGEFTVALEGDLDVPAGTLVDTYTSTVTADIIAAP
jgi:hypothetical protein